jgi:predicted amidophosphoribosyltransferase
MPPQEAAGNFCRNCGNKLSGGDNFCPKCGTKVKGE